MTGSRSYWPFMQWVYRTWYRNDQPSPVASAIVRRFVLHLWCEEISSRRHEPTACHTQVLSTTVFRNFSHSTDDVVSAVSWTPTGELCLTREHTPCLEKRIKATIFLPLTWPNADRFSKFFYRTAFARTFARTVSSELLGFVFSFSLFFVCVPCARLSWPCRQLLSARKYIVSYRITTTSCLPPTLCVGGTVTIFAVVDCN